MREQRKILLSYLFIFVIYTAVLLYFIKVPRAQLPDIFELRKTYSTIPLTISIFFVNFSEDENLTAQLSPVLKENLTPLLNRYIENGFQIRFKTFSIEREGGVQSGFKALSESLNCTANCFYLINTFKKTHRKSGKKGETGTNGKTEKSGNEIWTFNEFYGGRVLINAEQIVKDEVWQRFTRLIERFVLLETSQKQKKILDLMENDKLSLSFTLLNSDPLDSWAYSWDFAEIYKKHLQKLIDRLDFLDIDYDSQILNFGKISETEIKFDSAKNAHYLNANDLNTFIGKTQWNIETPGNNDREFINFLIFIPPKHKTPFEIRAEEKIRGSYIAPRWGGVVVFNSDAEELQSRCRERAVKVCDIDQKHFEWHFRVVVSQIRTMLGLDNSARLNSAADGDEKWVKVEERKLGGISEYEMRGLLYLRAGKNLVEYRRKLFSLYRQFSTVQELPIMQSVADNVGESIKHYETAVRACADEDIKTCFSESKAALEMVSEVSFDASIYPKNYISFSYMFSVFAPIYLVSFLPVVRKILLELKDWLKGNK